LRAYGERTGFPSKTGLYTSPHLIYPEERIRIGFRPISRGLFAKYFFEVWNSLLSDAENRPLPRYLQLMALTAFHAFIMENVEATIIETHHGGEYDATNVIEAPLVTMVTALGMDHVQQLGPSVENIAWHKSGIFKPGAYALSVLQDDCVADVLRKRATEKDVNLVFVNDDSALPNEALQLRPDVQRTNCSLALAGTRAFLKAKFRDHEFALLPQDVRQGVERFMWPGRFQVIEDGTSRWYLDGAHNEMSIVKAAEWYIDLTEAAG
jgi:folylpolyglutamate synthase